MQAAVAPASGAQKHSIGNLGINSGIIVVNFSERQSTPYM